LNNGKRVNTAEKVVQYLSKYLAKNFILKVEKPLEALRYGLLKGMGVYQFFRKIYG